MKHSNLFNPNNFVKTSFNIEKNDFSLIEEIALQERRKVSEIMREAVKIYLTNSITDKELLYSSLNDLKRRVEYLDKKLEIFFNFWFFSLTTTFAGLPDISNYSEVERKAITEKAKKRKNNMLDSFKRGIEEQASLFQMLLADFIEFTNEEKDNTKEKTK